MPASDFSIRATKAGFRLRHKRTGVLVAVLSDERSARRAREMADGTMARLHDDQENVEIAAHFVWCSMTNFGGFEITDDADLDGNTIIRLADAPAIAVAA